MGMRIGFLELNVQFEIFNGVNKIHAKIHNQPINKNYIYNII